MQFAGGSKCINRMPFAIFNQMNIYTTVFPIIFCRFLFCFHKVPALTLGDCDIQYCLLNTLETYRIEQPVERSKTSQNICTPLSKLSFSSHLFQKKNLKEQL